MEILSGDQIKAHFSNLALFFSLKVIHGKPFIPSSANGLQHFICDLVLLTAVPPCGLSVFKFHSFMLSIQIPF